MAWRRALMWLINSVVTSAVACWYQQLEKKFPSWSGIKRDYSYYRLMCEWVKGHFCQQITKIQCLTDDKHCRVPPSSFKSIVWFCSCFSGLTRWISLICRRCFTFQWVVWNGLIKHLLVLLSIDNLSRFPADKKKASQQRFFWSVFKNHLRKSQMSQVKSCITFKYLLCL